MGRLNRMLRGWSNYFCLGPVSPAYRAVDRHSRHRLRQWLCGKHKVKSRGTSRFPDQYLHEVLGLVRLSAKGAELPVGERMSSCPRARMRENRPPGSMSGEWKRRQGRGY